MTRELINSIAHTFLRVWKKHEPVVLMHVVYCDLCSNDDRGTKEELLRRGWTFEKGAEFCPRHQ